MKSTSAVLKQLRALMNNVAYVSTPIQAYIIPSSDSHQNEYLRACDKRREFISGFSGSAGTAIVTENQACLWTDGRYFLQASQEMDENWTLMKEGVPSTPSQKSWLGSTLPTGSRIGADPSLVPYSMWKELQDGLDDTGHELVAIRTNLVDLIWLDRPVPRNNPVVPLSVRYTGKTSAEKVEDVRREMDKNAVSTLVITALDEIAWLLNLRGSDIDFNPVFFAYVIVSTSSVYLFIDERKLSDAVTEHFQSEKLQVTIKPYDRVEDYVTACALESDGKIWLSKQSNYHLHYLIPNKMRYSNITPICLMKAIKNKVEAQGLIDCHVRDAAALCCYFAWLEKTIPHSEVTEVTGAEKLEEFRNEQTDYIGPSFETISSVGPNAAIIHYQPRAETARKITMDQVYLCDSGGQYKDGTTDVTRTLHFGTPTTHERDCYTRVLKGQIAIARSVFPSLIKGNCLDSFARRSLWEVGLDYQHGTSHGIGHFLNVHEGPMGISWRVYPDDPGLQKGMFLSNEPGYYEDGKFGIRLENIVHIVDAHTEFDFKQRGFLTFDTVTMVPIQLKMVNLDLLEDAEVQYINNYHELCRRIVGKKLNEMGAKDVIEWLWKETERIEPLNKRECSNNSN